MFVCLHTHTHTLTFLTHLKNMNLGVQTFKIFLCSIQVNSILLNEIEKDFGKHLSLRYLIYFSMNWIMTEFLHLVWSWVYYNFHRNKSKGRMKNVPTIIIQNIFAGIKITNMEKHDNCKHSKKAESISGLHRAKCFWFTCYVLSQFFLLLRKNYSHFLLCM
jgi:hypothetical protein